MIRNIVSTGLRQAKADIRPNLMGIGLVNFIFTPALLLIIAKFLDGRQLAETQTTVGSFLISGLIGAFGTILIMQVASEVYMEHLNGTLLRVKTLPHGVPSWMIGKALSAGALVFLQALIVGTVGVVVLIGDSSKIPAVIAVSIISILAHIPLAFIVSTWARGIWTALLAYAAGLVLLLISGGLISAVITARLGHASSDDLPRLLVHAALPPSAF
ncbi:hypothetical protein [Trueperella bialowiezensis]|uniref:ABC-2 family transporter protein n=1 Tax=Trueperella bialowiezensis TaxID=312285 RepID=A0A448PD55_9ACTO|nr:hypothetical protein [Trueperella bialowiezensis]VEI12860.1 Uncharacterised protein [Trueperella bialowiezensis]